MRISSVYFLATLVASTWGCTAAAPNDDGMAGTGGATGSGGDGGDTTGGDTTASGGGLNLGSGGGSGGGMDRGPYMLPDGYTAADLGGYQLGDEITESGGTSLARTDCGNEILGIVRDFQRGDQGGHPDFEQYFGSEPTTGLVEELLVDEKPVYSGTGHLGDPPQKQMTSEADFEWWYTTDESGTVNRAFEIRISLEPNGEVRTFDSAAFFPLDGEGFGNEEPFVVNEGLPDEQTFDPHNFHFTTEVHTEFAYGGGEVFSFEGDDDLWVFINDHLALDLGGLHPAASGSIDLDQRAAELEIEVGNEYKLDLFHAERGMPESNFRIDTSLEFTECGIIVK